MILPDVNVLVCAFHGDALDHPTYAAWLNQVAVDGDQILLPDAVLIGFVRVVTDRRIYSAPAPVTAAMAFALALRRQAAGLDEGDAVWQRLERLTAMDRNITGKVLPDAYLAAAALSHQARLATRDAGFGRFPGLRFFDPATAG